MNLDTGFFERSELCFLFWDLIKCLKSEFTPSELGMCLFPWGGVHSYLKDYPSSHRAAQITSSGSFPTATEVLEILWWWLKLIPGNAILLGFSRLLTISLSCFSLNWWVLVRIFSMLPHWKEIARELSFLKIYPFSPPLPSLPSFLCLFGATFHHFVRYYWREGHTGQLCHLYT